MNKSKKIMYIIVTEKYIALTIVLNTIIIAVYKSIAINYYLLKVQNTIAIHSDSEVLIYFILF